MQKEEKIEYIVDWFKKVVGKFDISHFRKSLLSKNEEEINKKYEFYKKQE